MYGVADEIYPPKKRDELVTDFKKHLDAKNKKMITIADARDTFVRLWSEKAIEEKINEIERFYNTRSHYIIMIGAPYQTL